MSGARELARPEQVLRTNATAIYSDRAITKMATEQEQISNDILGYLEQHQQKELLRFVSVGSVDDGKSTLIGRLLHDTHGIYEDQLSAVKRASGRAGMEIDFSLFTDVSRPNANRASRSTSLPLFLDRQA